MTGLGIGIGWRPEIADAVERLPGVEWVEAVAENLCAGHLPASLVRLRERGVTVVPHGVSLGLGGAGRPDPGRLARLAETATALGAPLVTEHVAFVRAGGPLTASPAMEAGHLLPVPRTREALDVLCENVRIAQEALPVPLALENVAALFSWPDDELTEGRFLTELVDRTGVRLLVDVANLHTNGVNRGDDPYEALAALPAGAIAYVHVAGGVQRDGVWHDTHAHPVPPAVLDLLAELASRAAPPGVLLERDDDFPPEDELAAELATIRGTVTAAGRAAGGGAAAGRAGRAVTGRAVTGRVVEAAMGRAAGGRAAVSGPVGGGAALRDGVTAPPEGTAVVRGGAAALRDGTAVVRDGARERLGLAQAALLSVLVAGTPAPEGFDGVRLRVQAGALVRKRAAVVAKVAPELPGLFGDGYRDAFAAYAGSRPMPGGYRQDALAFARYALDAGLPGDAAGRRRLYRWWAERSAPRPPGRAARLVHAARAALVR
ncbi:multinuclear nonheme iron-dependent oxidase [Streptomyces kanasensis]|uniref:multinuclear nonheme iron-dependent oxidase n=1 Tax=Streptomyces kanasensis TaxID=936756 RepID=UPI00381CF17A